MQIHSRLSSGLTGSGNLGRSRLGIIYDRFGACVFGVLGLKLIFQILDLAPGSRIWQQVLFDARACTLWGCKVT